MRLRIALVAGVVTLLGVAAEVAEQNRPEAAMAAAARRLIEALDDRGRSAIRFEFDSEERFNWHFVPRERRGLPWRDMTPAQRDLAVALLKTGFSAAGYSKAEAIRGLELVLRAAEKCDARDPDMYFLTIFGDPGSDRWAWRYEGHHMAQNWTIVNGRVAATSPAFFGANPAEVLDGPSKGLRVLPAEGDLAFALLARMSTAERAAAIVAGAVPNDILTGNSRKAAVLDPLGVRLADVSPQTRQLVMGLIEAHASAQHPALAADRLDRIRKAGIEHIRFGWIGATSRAPGAAHYYRIQGPTFLIEYDNTQNNANHQHIVWRDFTGDFGADLLAEHYAAVPHGHGDPGRR